MDKTEPLFVGVDGGGTCCRARVCDAGGQRLGEGVAGPANTRLGLDCAFGQVLQACRKALHQAGIAADAVARLHAGLGLAGLSLRSEQDKVRAYPHPFADVVADTDGYIACLGAHGRGDGAILIVGTGSAGYGVVGGRTFTVGGWGFQLADQGSGAAIGRAAVRRALWAFEGVVPATALTAAIMARFQHSTEAAVLWGDRAKPRDFAAFAPLVFDHADRGDALAQKLIGAAAADLALMIHTLHAQGAPAVAMVGGVARRIAPHLPADTQALLTTPRGDPLDGAVRMALEHYRRAAA